MRIDDTQWRYLQASPYYDAAVGESLRETTAGCGGPGFDRRADVVKRIVRLAAPHGLPR